MFRVTIAICLASALFCAVCLPWIAPVFGAGLMLAASQVLVYLVIAGFARLCRHSVVGSGVVLTMALLAVVLSLGIYSSVPPTTGYVWGFVFFWYIFAQVVVAVLGCYIGYMFIESDRLRRQNPGSNKGKLAVIAVLAAGVVAVGMFAILG
jgi:hypothetical protein